MVTALPRTVQLKLEQTLGQWQHWQCDKPLPGKPEMIAVLGQGLSNYSVHVRREKEFVVRIDGVNPARHGLNRQTEWRALQNASAAGIAPNPRYFNPELGTLVCDYLPPDATHAESITSIAELLRQIHRLPAIHHRLDLLERVSRYEHLAAQQAPDVWRELQVFAEPLRMLIEKLEDATSPPVCCHNDLLRANRLHSAGQLWAVDWEYCAMGSHWFDLAAIACGDDLSQEQIEALTDAYLQAPIGDLDRQHFNANCCVYRYLEILWFAAQRGLDPLDAEHRTRIQALRAALFATAG